LPFGIHYSWLIIGILATVQIFASSISMAAGIMVPPLNDANGEFGWGMGTIGAAIASYYLFGAIYAPMTGWLGDRYGSRWMLLAASLMYLISMFMLSQVTEVWHFFVFFGMLLSLTQSLAMVPLMAAVSGWFRRRLGLGVGILWGAGGVGTAVMAPLMGGFIEAYGWQTTFILIGAVGGGIMLAMVPFMRSKPADIGILPYGSIASDPPLILRDKTVERLRQKVFNQHTRRTKPFWNLPLVHGLGCAGHGTILIYVIPMAFERGAFTSLAQAGIILTIIALVSVISRVVTPILAENYGTRRMMAASLSIQAVTVFMLFWSQDAWAFYLFAGVFGIGFGGEWTGYLVINRQYYGDGPMGTIYGWQTTGALSGHAVATGLAGLVIYATGSFNMVMALSVGFSAVGILVISMLEDTTHVLIPNWEDDVPEVGAVSDGRLSPAPAAGDDD
jgi:MFS family permease